tara:strand:+ start:1633 stop:2196 length:564 start_codon:yes stop_codon:yes gene_type:complete
MSGGALWDTALAFAIPLAWLVVSLQDNDFVNTNGCSIVSEISNYALTPLACIFLAWKDNYGTALGLLAAMLLQSGMVNLIKHRTYVERPTGSPYSFPSGHAASASTVSYYLLFTLLYKCEKNPGCGMLLISGTLLWAWHASCCRLNEGKHYPADLAGAHIIALVVSLSMILLLKVQHLGYNRVAPIE